MNLNPFYHLKRYRQLITENSALKEKLQQLDRQNNRLLDECEQLASEKQNLLKQVDDLHEPELKPIFVKRQGKHKKRERNGH